MMTVGSVRMMHPGVWCAMIVSQPVTKTIVIPMQRSFGISRMVVYLDWHAGVLSFYRVSSDTLVYLHTFHGTFTEPLYPAFGIELNSGSSVSLCQMWGGENSLTNRIIHHDLNVKQWLPTSTLKWLNFGCYFVVSCILDDRTILSL